MHKLLIAATASVGTVATALAGVALLGGDDKPTKVLGDVIVQPATGGPSTIDGGSPANGGASTGAPAEFSIDGGITGLFPGALRGIPLHLSNPYPFAINVTAVTARVDGTSNPACPVRSLSFDALRDAPVFVPAGGNVAATLPVRMHVDADNVCAGLTFTLSYTGEAVQA